jgi:hypothetical protein
MQQLMTEGISSADLERLMRQWMPNFFDKEFSGNFADWQKSFWAAAMGKSNS